MDVFVRSFGEIGQNQEQSDKKSVDSQPSYIEAGLHPAEDASWKSHRVQQFHLEAEHQNARKHEKRCQNPFPLFHGQEPHRYPEQVDPFKGGLGCYHRRFHVKVCFRT